MPFSLVPGFAQRYPKEDDDERHSRLDQESAPIDAPSPVSDNRPAQPDPDCHARPDFDCHSRLDRASLLIETCCTTLDEALSAQARGANRIELCVDLSIGGVTPPHDLIREVVQNLTIPVNVLIRPEKKSPVKPGMTNSLNSGGTCPSVRSDYDHAAILPDNMCPSVMSDSECLSVKPGDAQSSVMSGSDRASGFSAMDFVYDEAEVQQMMADIEFCKSVGVAGIVVGALTPDGAIDWVAMKRLIAAARPLPVTFHRAFDVCTADPFLALDQIIALGCTRLLTSGMAATAWDGRCLITLLVRRAGSRLIVMPGRGVTPANLAALAAATHATEFHGTAIP